ncbi:MAG: ribosome-binding factor A [Candidatus Peribacteraceae bacterium]|nr:ribosome-binding factor A [Candidatus Peribacteraceae bacterium]
MSKRSAMLGSVIRGIIAPVLRECPPECGVVTITDVVVSEDFSYATVSVSALQSPESALKFLEGRVGELQKKLGALRRRHIPRLRFRLDRTAERGDRIDTLLKSLE